MKYGRTDSNQPDIVKALLRTGHSVQILSDVGKGCPDLLVGRNGRNFLLECKVERGAFTGDQAIWHNEWKGQAAVVRSPSEAVEVISNAIRGR